jgi:hypothetical protein
MGLSTEMTHAVETETADTHGVLTIYFLERHSRRTTADALA